MTGINAEQAEKNNMQAVLDIETKIATVSYSATKLRDIEANYHKMSYAELLSNYPVH